MPLRKSDAATTTTRTSDDEPPAADGAGGPKQALTLAEMAGTETAGATTGAAAAPADAAPADAAAAADPGATTREGTPDEQVPSSPAVADGSRDGKGGGDKEGGARRESRGEAATIEDFALPRSVLTRLAKGVLPANTQIQGTAVQAMTKSATVFISHLAHAANTLTAAAGKKTIMPADVLAALDEIEFGFMRPQLEEEFAKFNHIRTSKRSDYRRRIAAAKKATGDEEHDADVSADVSAMDGPGANGSAKTTGKAAAATTATGPSSSPARDTLPPLAKKAKRGPATDEDADEQDDEDDGDVDESHIDVDGEEEEENEEEDEEEEEEEEEDDDDDDDVDVDPLEAERADGLDEDEALDSDGSE